MEFPHVGQNCSYKSCNRLDFLPMKCDSCKSMFCGDHLLYEQHECPTAHTKDVQVPQCPLCGVPVPGRRGEPPDVAVGAHIDNQCMSDRARENREKVFKNRCSYKGCKAKELMPILCVECSLNFCLRHRHPPDHTCEGKLAAKRKQAADAALLRLRASQTMAVGVGSLGPLNTPPADLYAQVHGGMSEDEALARALALSMEEESVQARDNRFARALAQRTRVGGGDGQSRCEIS